MYLPAEQPSPTRGEGTITSSAFNSRLSPLMTWRHIAPRPRDAFRPSFCIRRRPRKRQGRREGRVAAAPGALAQKKICASAKVHRYRRRHSGLPRAVVYGLYALSLVSQCLFATIISQQAFGACARLDASVGASGPHDFAVRISAARLTAPSRPPQPAPRFVTIAIRPLCRGGIGEAYGKSEIRKSEIFFRARLDINSCGAPVGQINGQWPDGATGWASITARYSRRAFAAVCRKADLFCSL